MKLTVLLSKEDCNYQTQIIGSFDKRKQFWALTEQDKKNLLARLRQRECNLQNKTCPVVISGHKELIVREIKQKQAIIYHRHKKCLWYEWILLIITIRDFEHGFFN